jgi:hypothetical protein
MKQLNLIAVAVLLGWCGLALGQVKSEDLAGKWSLDRSATTERAVAKEEDDKQKETVRKQLTERLPEQSVTFGADGKYLFVTTIKGRKPAEDKGTYALEGEEIVLNSEASGERRMKAAREGEALVLSDMLVFKKQ